MAKWYCYLLLPFLSIIAAAIFAVLDLHLLSIIAAVVDNFFCWSNAIAELHLLMPLGMAIAGMDFCCKGAFAECLNPMEWLEYKWLGMLWISAMLSRTL
ncbi:hypothetical protein U1Q18_045536, partial [Sarracenia purpurea var. burkii]